MGRQLATPEWADPLVTSRNRVLTHAPLAAYPDVDSARVGDRMASPHVAGLNGVWAFRLTPNPAVAPEGFADPGADDGDWQDMPVPSNWQLQPGVDDPPIYTNVPYPFRPTTPPAPPEVNPTGWYRTSFDVPAAWDGRRLFLVFESCDSACKVWVNGVEVGYSQDSKLPHEFEITGAVRSGENHLAVMVPRYCDGFWLECQDYWHLSGIQRDVYLVSKPQAYLRDFVVRTHLDAAFRDAELEAVAFMNEVEDLPDGYTVRADLFDPEGRPVDGGSAEAPVALSSPMYGDTAPEYTGARLLLPVKAPRLWTAETPALYSLVLTLVDPSGRAVDHEGCRVGFRQVEIRDRVLLLNGRRLVVRGVDCHEHHPEKGRALTEQDMRDELVAMKRLNFNAVRTSHYPHHTVFYDLCDELGLYVIDEANLETHGIGALTSKDPLWLQAYVERAQRMALRDRNHPCVIGWSLGNESSYGPHHAAMAHWLRHADPTRPVQYESGYPGPGISDVLCPMYPRIPWVEEVMADPRETRPMIMCEYAYSKGNANGNVKKYWDLVDRWPSFQGGFVWDWRDKALVREVAGRKEWAYGNEFDGGVGPDGYDYGSKENPQMCLNGVVLPDLTPKPGAYELKNVQAPVAFERPDAAAGVDEGTVTVWNKYHALDLSHLEIRWAVTQNGYPVAEGCLAAPATAPGERTELSLPLSDLPPPAPGAEVWLNLEARRREATAWSEPGHMVGWRQFSLPAGAPAGVSAAPGGTPAAKVREDGGAWVLEAGALSAAFDPQRGALTALSLGGLDLVTRPLVHAFFRARTDNDYIIGNPGSYYQDWLAAGLDRLVTRVVSFETGGLSGGAAIARCETRHVAEGCARGFTCRTVYALEPDGVLSVSNEVTADQGLPVLPRIGMALGVRGDCRRLAWYGRGPHESYCDRKESTPVGLYRSTVDEQFVPFVDPCECGGHEDTRWMELTAEDGSGLRFEGAPALHVSALPYTVEALLEAGHVYELERADDVIVHLDGSHMGVGGDTGWTRNVHPEYLLRPGVYRYGFRLLAPRGQPFDQQ